MEDTCQKSPFTFEVAIFFEILLTWQLISVSNKSKVYAYCFWDQNPAHACLFDTVRLLVLEEKSIMCNY